MLYTPKSTCDFLSEDNFDKEFTILENQLSLYRQSGFLNCHDGVKLNYNYYLNKNATKNVVIVHGLSEFIRKYHEMIYFYLNNNCNVFIYEQRYHGYSDRPILNYDLIHVDSFDDYVKDLSSFIDTVVKASNDLPICLFSHSMGGAIVGLYLQQNPTAIDKAIFCAPMICPTMQNVPRFIMRNYAKSYAKKTSWDAPFKYAHTFNPNVKVEESNDLSEKRFLMNLSSRILDDHNKCSAFSNKWIYEATFLQSKLIKKCNEKITTKVLIFAGGLDKVVKLKPIIKYSKTLKNKTLCYIENAKHNIYNSTQDILQTFYNAIKEFIK